MCQVGSHQQRERERERHAPRVSTNEMPSIQASRHPPMTAEIADALSPPRAARMPPVAAPEMMAFQGSCVARPVSDASWQRYDEHRPTRGHTHLLLAYLHQRAVDGREESGPDGEAAAGLRSARLQRSKGAAKLGRLPSISTRSSETHTSQANAPCQNCCCCCCCCCSATRDVRQARVSCGSP